MSTGRVLAIDYGRARIGLALSDPGRILASPLATVSGKLGPKGVIDAIADKKVAEIVVGLPLLLNGTKGEMTLEVEAFAKKLGELTEIPIRFWDERLTSAQAERHLKEEHGMTRKQRAAVSDEAAAVVILQSYLGAF